MLKTHLIHLEIIRQKKKRQKEPNTHVRKQIEDCMRFFKNLSPLITTRVC